MSKAMFVDFPENITKANQLIPDKLRNDMYVVQTEPFFIEMMNKQASKGKTLGELADQLNLTKDNIMAIGDQGNDFTMVDYAGFGVAMGNAIDEVKKKPLNLLPSPTLKMAWHLPLISMSMIRPN